MMFSAYLPVSILVLNIQYKCTIKTRSVVKWSATQKTCSSDILELQKTV